jgi:sugar phosphate isomerase/epimerase
MRPTRREFLFDVSLAGAAAMAASRVSALTAAQAGGSAWTSRIGLELYTVRDLMETDYVGVLEKVAAIGYKEVETSRGYNNLSPKEFRALLDRLGLTMPSAHSGPSGTGLELEKQLEGFQTMGIKYTVMPGTGRGGQARGGAPPAAAADRGRGPLPPGAYFNAGTGRTHNSFTEAEAFGPYAPPVTLESVKQRAAALNANGRLAQKFGIKPLVHNHTDEFEKCSDSPRTPYEVLVEETDPALVAMQLDIGWAYVAGVDPIALFKKYPGRFELWHLKDVFGLKKVNPSLGPNDRVSSVTFVPIGVGQIDYKPVFANAQLAGLKHFVIEQDNAATFGDSLAAARVSYRNMLKVLS